MRFLASGRGELRPVPVGRGEEASVKGDRSQSKSWQSSPVRHNDAKTKQTRNWGSEKKNKKKKSAYTSMWRYVWRTWTMRTCGCEQGSISRAPSQRVHLRSMCSKLHDRLPRTTHIQYLHVDTVHMERGHIIRIARVERNPQEGRRRRTGGRRRGGRGRGQVLGRWSLVEYRRVFQGAQVERS